MKVEIKVVSGAKKSSIEYIGKNNDTDFYKIKLNAKPIEGQANKELIKILSDYFGVSKYNISILRGEKSKNKTLEINK